MPKLIRITTSPLSLKSLLSNQMRFMRENGFDVLMVSSEGKEWSDLARNEGCAYRIIPMTRQITPFKDLRSLWQLYQLFRKEKPDIVHSHTPKAGLLAMLAARMAGVKIRIHTIAGLRFMTATGMSRKLLVNMEKLTGHAARYVWPNSNSLLQYIRENKLISPKKLEVIGAGSSNGVDLDRYSVSVLDPVKLDRARTSINYSEECIYLLNMGRIVRDKGIDEVLYAFSKLHLLQPQLRLILLGSFEDKLDPVSDEARTILQTHPAIIHIEWSDEAEYYMHLAKGMVHASYREGFPSTLLQAGAMGCPIVCSAIEGSVDIVTNKETGLLFEPRNREDLFEKLHYALNNPGEMEQMAGRLREKIERHFSQRQVHRALRDRYFDLLRLHGKPVINPA